jgi:hypothetical protein
MTNRTERELHIALGKLLNRVRVQNSWSAGSFIEAAKHTANVSKSEAFRFFKALEEMNYLKPASDKRKLTSNFNANVWTNVDMMLGLVKEVVELHPITKAKGPKKGYKRVLPHTEQVVEQIVEEVIVVETDPFANLTNKMLVDELRRRGCVVTCTESVTITREL